MSSKEKVLIIFNGSHLAYSPTTIQLHEELSKKYDVHIIAQHPRIYTGQALEVENILYHKYFKVKGRYFYLVLFQILSLFSKEIKDFKKNKLNYKDYFFRYLFIKKIIRNNDFKRIICIDNVYLYFCSLLKVKVDFLSLELCLNENLVPLVDRSFINCVLIQSKERYGYLFGDEKLKTFYVQNAPIYTELERKQERKSLIYAGSTIKSLGFYNCLDYLKKYSTERLTVQGAMFEEDRNKVNNEYSNLLEDNRLVINNTYLDNDKMVEFLSDYEIGFCFYLLDDMFIKEHYFNYISAPSGKMFKYIAAGVPVICSNILGFNFVKEFNCGILIDNLNEEGIHEAVLTIRKDYNTYVENAIKAAKHFSFDTAIKPYMEFIA